MSCGTFIKHRKTSFSSSYWRLSFLLLQLSSFLFPGSELISKIGTSKSHWCRLSLPSPTYPSSNLHTLGWLYLQWVFPLVLVPTPWVLYNRGLKLSKVDSTFPLGSMGPGERKKHLEFSLEVETGKEATSMHQLLIFFFWSCFREWLGVNLKRNLTEFPILYIFLYVCT